MNVKVLGFGLITTVGAIAGLALCVPNVLWLRHSTVRIDNQGDSVISNAQLQVGSQTLDYYSIEPGDALFALLPQKARGSVAVMLPPSQTLDSFCHTYVDANLYHVDITVADGKVVNCDASLPILSGLWVLKALF